MLKNQWVMDGRLYDRCCGERPRIAHAPTAPTERRYSAQCVCCGRTVEVKRAGELPIQWNLDVRWKGKAEGVKAEGNRQLRIVNTKGGGR